MKLGYNPDMIALPDCCWLSEQGYCTRLRVTSCAGQSCPFLKTQEQEQSAFEKAQQRLRDLDPARQQKIANKYYGGSYPWNAIGKKTASRNAGVGSKGGDPNVSGE